MTKPPSTRKPRPIKTVELFAGVGGFRLGLEGYNGKSASSGYRKPLTLKRPFKVVWSNQWEPASKRQHASEVYERRWGRTGHSNDDITTVPTSAIPNHDLLVGGFPCQDYSVAATLNRSGGIEGKKGVLWWEIHRILSQKGANKPRFIFLENVDRLLKSPVKQRGRDFAIMLACLADLGYAVEWRVVNAADYGMPQRRRRTFIVGYLANSKVGKSIRKHRPDEIIQSHGVLAKALPIQPSLSMPLEFTLDGSISEISTEFGRNSGRFFEVAGFMLNRHVSTIKTSPAYSGRQATMGDYILHKDVPDQFIIPDSELPKWQALKGPKKIQRVSAEGFAYMFSEGGIAFPDPLDRPFRTIITGEGGLSPSRFKHVIVDSATGKYRRLTPVELERANMFPDRHTEVGDTISDEKRAFFMGNALVIGVIEAIGRKISDVAS